MRHGSDARQLASGNQKQAEQRGLSLLQRSSRRGRARIMPEKTETSGSDLPGVLREVGDLADFAGPPKQFWPRLLACLGRLISADKVVLLVQNRSAGTEWKQAGDWPPQAPPSRMLSAFLGRATEAATRYASQGGAGLVLPLEARTATGGHFILATRVAARLQQSENCVVVCLLSEVPESVARESLVRLELAARTADAYLVNLAARQAQADVEKFAGALDLAMQVGGQRRFLAAAMALCNGIASRHGCHRVSVGFVEGGYVRVKAISRTEKFGRQMVAVQGIEKTMEEALDQDDEVVWPAPEGATVLTRDHEQFSKEQGANNVCSVPMRAENKPVGVLTCERQSRPFTATELQQLRLCCDLLTAPLLGLKKRDRWFGARWAAGFKEQTGKLVGPEHTWAKLLALTVAAALVVFLVVPVPYRVEGNFILRSDELVHLTAPFDGYIQEVFVRPGDRVEAGDKLLALRTDELRLEEAAAIADHTRYHREAEKERAAGDLAEMRINQALLRQVQARLDLIRYRIGQSTMKAPFSGVLVEGDLRDRLGAPVKLADVLMRVARIDTLYVEAEVDERDIHEVIGKSTGQIAFLSQPRKKYAIRVVNLEQAAFPKDQGNVFLVRCAVDGGPQAWWRPGMSGVSKFNVEKRTLFWIFTHHTVDFLRMKLWW